MNLDEVLAALWDDYTRTTPQASRIHGLFAARGERIENDHVAFRTYALPGIGLAAMARPFVALGFAPRETYTFPDKHLRAQYFQHPRADVPKLFVSELVVTELPPAAQSLVRALYERLPVGFAERDDFPWAGRPWTPSHTVYRELLAASEYAAWVAAFGFRVNHFTVNAGALTTFADLDAVNAFLVAEGFVLNDVGGTIKGSRAQCLEQSSTRADAVDVTFEEGSFRVPSCYYEFAKRYPLASGGLFQGFVPTSADKIFHSTDVGR